MRRILIDRARQKQALKRGGDLRSRLVIPGDYRGKVTAVAGKNFRRWRNALSSTQTTLRWLQTGQRVQN